MPLTRRSTARAAPRSPIRQALLDGAARFIRTPLGAGLAMAVWEFQSTVATYYVASGSFLAVPAQTVNTAFWLLTIGIVVSDRRPIMVSAILGGGAVGLLGGIAVIRAVLRG